MHNIDATEIAKFDAAAAHWWDPHGELKSLHDINPLRLDFIEQCASLKGKKVLDIGCGGGLLTEGMATRGAEVTGIDMSEATLQVAQLHAQQSQLAIEYHHSSAEAFVTDHASKFDVVTCLEVLEHVPDPTAIVNASAQLVKTGGNVIFSTINRNPKAYLFAILGAEYLLNMLPRGMHDYAKFIRPSELAGWARKATLSVNKLCGMKYHLLEKTYSLSKDVTVNYFMHCQKVIVN